MTIRLYKDLQGTLWTSKNLNEKTSRFSENCQSPVKYLKYKNFQDSPSTNKELQEPPTFEDLHLQRERGRDCIQLNIK